MPGLPGCSHHAPPPYSWTAERAFAPAGSRSVRVPSSVRRTSWVRPPSVARPSAHTTPVSSVPGAPSGRTSPSRTAAVTTTSDVTGVGHDPYPEIVTATTLVITVPPCP